MTRGIIFDCFGVLYVDAAEAYFSRFPEHAVELADLDKAADRGLIERADYVASAARITGDAVSAVEQAIVREHVANKELISYIKSELKPRYKIGLLSNIGRGWIQDFFDEHQLHDLFDAVVLSSEEGMTKPDPIIFERIAERLGLLPAECIMVDDIRENCHGAEAVGMRSILFSDNDQLRQDLAPILKENHEN